MMVHDGSESPSWADARAAKLAMEAERLEASNRHAACPLCHAVFPNPCTKPDPDGGSRVDRERVHNERAARRREGW